MSLLPESPWWKEERLPNMEHLPLPLGCRDPKANPYCWSCLTKWSAAKCKVGLCLQCHNETCQPEARHTVSPDQLVIE